MQHGKQERPWTKTEAHWDVYFDVTRAIKEEFDRAGVSIPYPNGTYRRREAIPGRDLV